MGRRRKFPRKYGPVTKGREKQIDGEPWRLIEDCPDYVETARALAEYRCEGLRVRREIVESQRAGAEAGYYRVWMHTKRMLKYRPRTLKGEVVKRGNKATRRLRAS